MWMDTITRTNGMKNKVLQNFKGRCDAYSTTGVVCKLRVVALSLPPPLKFVRVMQRG